MQLHGAVCLKGYHGLRQPVILQWAGLLRRKTHHALGRNHGATKLVVLIFQRYQIRFEVRHKSALTEDSVETGQGGVHRRRLPKRKVE